MNEKFLFKTVIKKYSHPKEIDYLKKISRLGLEDYEEIIIEKYCKPPGTALVIGCGAGRESIILAKKHLRIIGIDIVEELVRISDKETRKNSAEGYFSTMDASQLGFKADCFNYAILLGQVISLIPFRKNRIRTLKECKRVLKDDGTLILTTHSRERNLKEKLKWQIINLIRTIRYGKLLEKGDKWVTAISGYKLSEEKIFMHLYTPREAIEDIKTAELKLIDVMSATEIVNKRYCPKIREKDKYIVYIAKK